MLITKQTMWLICLEKSLQKLQKFEIKNLKKLKKIYK